ncbi:hypothetical protein BC332_14901 [Capsicum chinense]|nr:hypothetical protein BC332_14901 [Capsicum chinense]
MPLGRPHFIYTNSPYCLSSDHVPEGKKPNLDAKRVSSRRKEANVLASTSANADSQFVTIIKPYAIIRALVYLPSAFARPNGLMRRCKMILRDEKQRSWSVQLGPVGPRFGITRGWRQFREANAVQVGDTYKFELIGNGTIPVAYFCLMVSFSMMLHNVSAMVKLSEFEPWKQSLMLVLGPNPLFLRGMLGPSKLMPKLVAGLIGRSFVGVPPKSEVVRTRSSRNQKYRQMDLPDRSLVTGAARCLYRRSRAAGNLDRRQKHEWFERRRGTGNGREKRVERTGEREGWGWGLSLPVTGVPTPSPASAGQGAVVVGLVNVRERAKNVRERVHKKLNFNSKIPSYNVSIFFLFWRRVEGRIIIT